MMMSLSRRLSREKGSKESEEESLHMNIIVLNLHDQLIHQAFITDDDSLSQNMF